MIYSISNINTITNDDDFEALEGYITVDEILGISSFNFLSDINLNSLADNHFLVYDFASLKWVNKQASDALVSLGITATANQINYLDITTLGETEPGKVLTTDSSGNITLSGNLTVNGTTTTINSETSVLIDPVITLGGPDELAVNDSKDRGVEFRWYDGSSSKLGFFGFDNSSSKFVFIPDATNATEVFSGDFGGVAFGSGEFSGDLSVNTSTLKVDTSNDRIGINKADPQTTFHIISSSTSDSYGLGSIAKFESSSTGDSLYVLGDALLFNKAGENSINAIHSDGTLTFKTAALTRLSIDNLGVSTFSNNVVLQNASSLVLNELSTNGSHYIAIKAPDSVASNVTLVLPDGIGTSGQVLTTDGSGFLSWSTVSTGLTSTDITGQTAKTVINDNDLIIIADSEDSDNLKKVTKLDFVAGLSANKTFEKKTSNFTAQVNYHYSVNTTSGALVVTLPQITTTDSGDTIIIKFRDGLNSLTISPYSGDSIEDLSNVILTDSSSPGQSLTLVSDGLSDWEII